MKELEMTVQLRNNRLKKRRKELNMSQKQIADAIGISLQLYGALETIRDAPRNKDGQWRPAVMKIAAFFCEEPEELFSPGIEKIKKSSICQEVDVEALDLLTSDQQQRLALPSVCVEVEELKGLITKALKGLPVKEAAVLRYMFGIDGEEAFITQTEIAKHLNTSKDMVRIYLRKGLRNLRRGPYWRDLILFTDEEKIELYLRT